MLPKKPRTSHHHVEPLKADIELLGLEEMERSFAPCALGLAAGEQIPGQSDHAHRRLGNAEDHAVFIEGHVRP